MEAVDVDHDLFLVDEFDALAIELKTPDEPEEEVTRKYPAKLHTRKVVKELGAKDGLIYLPGQLEASWEDSDMGPPFRQRRYFYYMSGANFPGCALTYDIAADKLTLWIPYTPPASILYFGNTPSPDDCLTVCDVHDVKYTSELSSYLASRLPTMKTLYALRHSQLPRFDGFDEFKRSLTLDVTSLQPAMDRARLIKTDYELDMIRKANDISSAAHRAIYQRVSAYSNECQIEAHFRAVCTAQNSHSQSYPIIAGSGPNASTLHYGANNEPLAGRQLIVLDAGCEWKAYASDITRTLPVGGRFTAQGRAIYDIVLNMQDECIARVRPGVVYRDLHLHATLVAVRGLLQLGILRGADADTIFRNGTGAAFFPHGLGHHVGLDVHDVLSRDLLRPAGEATWGKRRPVGPQTLRAMIRHQLQEQQEEQVDAGAAVPHQRNDSSGSSRSSGSSNSSKSQHNKLQPGMVVTIEPGIYFCKPYIEAYFLAHEEHKRYIDLEVLDQYWKVGGSRVEDCVLVTEDGRENLTKAPKF